MRRELIAYEDPKSHVSELFRTLRTNVQFMNSNRKLKTLLITSTLPGEGKSWISSNLAITFAQADKRVLLIDADMRKCSLHRVFRVASCPGLSNYLAGLNDSNDETVDFGKFIRETEVPNLYLLPSGNVPPNPSELLASPQMITLLDELKSEFDIIIIDGTPSKLVTDAVILSRLVDSTIIVTGHNMVKKDDLSKTIKDIQNVGGRIAGVVYNKKPVSGKKMSETYYYASAPMKVDSKKKQQEIEYEQRRQAQRSRANDMIKRDRNPNEPKEIQKQEEQHSEPQEQPRFKIDSSQAPEDRATEMLKQFNDYLQKEKENIDKRNI